MQWVLNGLSEGLVVGLLSLAFMLVYSGTRVFFLAMAGVYSLAPFIASEVFARGLGWPIALLAGLASSALLAISMEVLSHWPLEKRGTQWTGHFVASMGFNLVITAGLAMIWGAELKSLGLQPAGTVANLLGVRVGYSQAVNLAVVPLVLLVFFLWVQLTPTGLRIRALSVNPEALILAGVNIRKVRTLIFGVSGVLAGCAALLAASDAGFDASGGLPVVILAFIALIIGGKDAYLGGIIGGVLIGLQRAAVGWFASDRWVEPVTFLILTIFLLFSPSGLLGRKATRIEAG